MNPSGSIFLDFRLPNATSWFYISLLVSVALFFRFRQPLCLRNWDLLMLFALVPGFLFLSEARAERERAEALRLGVCAQHAGQCVLAGAPVSDASALLSPLASPIRGQADTAIAAYRNAERDVWQAYLALLVGTVYFLVRCLVDLTLVRRPHFQPNLSPGGLAFLGGTLLVVLSVKTMLPPAEPVDDGKATSVVLEKAKAAATLAADQVNQDRVEIDPELWMARSIAIGCHVVVVLGLVWIGWRQLQSLHAGLGAASLYLLLPYTARYTQELAHVLPAALMVLAVVWYRRPLVCGCLLGLASGLVYFPVLLFPAWFGFYRGKGARRFALGFAGVLVPILAYFFLDPTLRPLFQSALQFPDWRGWDLSAKPIGEGLWTGLDLHFAYRVPLFIAHVAIVVATAFWPSPKNLGHLLALSAAIIMGVQFWYADSGGIYVLWYLPLLLLVTIRPGLSTRFAPDPETEPNHFRRAVAWVQKRLTRPTHQPVA